MKVVCPNCKTIYNLNMKKLPQGKRAVASCKECGGKIVIEPDHPLKNGPENTLAISFNYCHSKVIDVSKETLRYNRLEAFFDDSPVSDQYKILRTQILQRTKKEGLNTILITSPGDSEGKSITAANLAISLAREAVHTVLLVDADLRNPSLGQLFGIDPVDGLSDCLLNGRPLSDLLINPGINKLTLLIGNHRLSNSAEIIGSPRMKQLIHEMKNRYKDRYIIFDSPPLIGSADTLILSEFVDGVILVVEYGKTQKNQIEKALQLLEGRNLVGTILNKAVIPKKQAYASGYSF